MASEDKCGYPESFKIKSNDYSKGFVNYENTFYIKKIDDVKFHKFAIPIGLKKESNIHSYLEYNNELEFSIRRFYKKSRSNDRLFVIIYCYDKENNEFETLNYYTSISDGSFWRFCVQLDDENPYDKGYNYISTTFINIYLQRFILEHMDLFNIVIDHDKPCLLSSEVKTIEYLNERINKNTYVHKARFFLIMNTVFPPPDYIKYYKECVKRLIECISTYTENNNSKSKLKMCSDIFCSLQKAELSTDIVLSDETSRRTFFTKIKTVFCELFLKYYELNKKTKKKVFDKKFTVGLLEFNASIYSIEFTSKQDHLKYVLYYMIYNNNKIGKHKTFIHIIPQDDAGITKYGLDKHYVAAGPLINKLFDYTGQAVITALKGDIDLLTPGYRYIGDLTDYGFLP